MGVTVGSLVVLSSSQSLAETDNYISDFFCSAEDPPGNNPTSQMVPAGAKVPVTVSIPKTVPIGQPLELKWTLGDSPFKAPGDFEPKAKVIARGSAGISDYWSGVGTLDSMGELVVDKALQNGKSLALPALTPGSYIVGKEGEIKVTPRSLTVQFVPPELVSVVNDSVVGTGDQQIDYQNDGWGHSVDRKVDDIEKDVHHSTSGNAEVSFQFTGTGVEYITERDDDMGKVEVAIYRGGETTPISDPNVVDASKEADEVTPVPAEVKRTKQTLWSVNGLKYGTYKVVLKNKSPDKYMIVDAFRVLREPKPELYTHVRDYNAICRPSKTTTATVKVEKASASPSPSPTTTTPTPKPTVTVTATPGGTATAKPTMTVTATVTPTRATPTTPQVTRVPRGGADTGVGPEDERSGMGLVGLGSVMVFGSAMGGVMLRRRRAAHARGRS
ncbi:hypothetical protein HS041_07880 [Planomonospora sp. ID67723]|uniref:hypothetical protein n=1 Tax=Planomonospora sp. ID67723 TaxID=2738134 RepID=UPI0018C447A7|nr:hypothetical protein [Planomonospora sp. ID67723]MBG0827680.1 hypothetical protein [Planomonospora sp. ID67723]